MAEGAPEPRRPLATLRGLLGAARFVGVLALGITLGGGLLELSIFREIDTELATLEDWRPLTTCRVLDHQGAEFDHFSIERRTWVPLEELPPAAWQAVLAAEDSRFLDHPGIDLLGIGRAMWANLMAGDVVEGGSTLTQQLAKNLLVGKQRTYARKAREALVALRLEHRFTKQEILELYLNYVFLGSGNYGIEAAAQDYFGLSARQVDAGQAALLAGLIPAPSRYSPRRDPELAARRRQLVLGRMVDQGYVSPEAAATYAEAPVEPPPRPSDDARSGDHYRTALRRELRTMLGRELPHALGLTVHTAYDPEVQRIAEEAVREAALDVEARQGMDGPVRRLAMADIPAFIAAGEGLVTGPEGALELPGVGSCLPMVVTRSKRPLQAGPFKVNPPWSTWARKVRSRDGEEPARSLYETAQPGEVYELCRREAGWALAEPPWVEGAAVVIDHHSGEVVAMVGGRAPTLEGFLRATQARRQPGSSFKPYVFVAAMMRGASQVDPVLDAPLALPGGNGQTWRPGNYSGEFYGRVPLRTALAHSLNTVAVRLALDVGPEEIARVATALGVRTPLRTDLTIALGTSEVTVLDQAVAYGALARGGVALPPIWVTALDDGTGARLAEAGGALRRSGQPPICLPGGPGRRVIPEDVAFQTVQMLEEAVVRGTGRSAHQPGEARAGKTGTTSAFADAWFVGMTPHHTVAVWIGSDDRSSLGPKETGGRAALPAWRQIVEGLPSEASFPLPASVIQLPWEGRWVAVSRAAPPLALLTTRPVDPGPLPPFPGG